MLQFLDQSQEHLVYYRSNHLEELLNQGTVIVLSHIFFRNIRDQIPQYPKNLASLQKLLCFHQSIATYLNQM